jgi:hypothetical protein
VTKSAPLDFAWESSDDRTIISGPGLRIVFTRVIDRWTHSLQLAGEEGYEIARAVETDPDRESDLRIVSPVYQEIHRHDLGLEQTLCALLTGRLFQHHFSAAVSLRKHGERPGSVVLDFDVADRCRAPCESLAATYAVRLDSSALLDAGPGLISWEIGGQCPGRVDVVALASCTLALAEAGTQRARVQAVAAIERGTFTHRLRYRWTWTSASDLTR